VRPAAAAPLVAAVAAAFAVGCAGDDAGPLESPSLEGVAWVLVAGIDVEGSEETGAPSATFDSGGLSGRAVCNSYATSYTVDGSALELQPVAWTQIACPPPAAAVEEAFFEALERVQGWALADDELVLLNADGDKLLRFEPAPDR
jgi:heat shock protein HslJ